MNKNQIFDFDKFNKPSRASLCFFAKNRAIKMKILPFVDILTGFSGSSEFPVVFHVSEAQMVCEWVVFGMY